MSCGPPPSSASTRRARSAIERACAVSMACSSAECWCASSPRMTHRCGVTAPETSPSPIPVMASITTQPRSPVTGSAVNATPAAVAATIGCTRTASRGGSNPA